MGNIDYIQAKLIIQTYQTYIITINYIIYNNINLPYFLTKSGNIDYIQVITHVH